MGPDGKLFDAALETAGIERSRVYVTNAVKHFKFEPRGKRRIHSKPNAGEIRACRFWLEAERELVKPRTIVAMGASALSSVAGKNLGPIATLRGRPIAVDRRGTASLCARSYCDPGVRGRPDVAQHPTGRRRGRLKNEYHRPK